MRCRNVVELEIGIKTGVVNIFFNAVLDDRFHLRSEDEFIFIKKVEQWFDSISIASDKKTLFLSVVNAKGKKTVEFIQAIFFFVDVKLEQHFGVGVGMKLDTFLFKLCL